MKKQGLIGSPMPSTSLMCFAKKSAGAVSSMGFASPTPFSRGDRSGLASRIVAAKLCMKQAD